MADKLTHLSYREQLQRALTCSLLHTNAVRAAENALQQAAAGYAGKWVVLDDDPTGVQTVHDLPVYTDWSVETLCAALREEGKMFYILTNSRGLTRAETIRLHTELMAHLKKAEEVTGVTCSVISRSDSTLRGHFPLETNLIGAAIGGADGVILAPFFAAGGRITIDNVHYVKYGDELVPAGETEFAKDQTFGYTSSNLCEYVAEKTRAEAAQKDVPSGSVSRAFAADEVLCVSLDILRKGEVSAVLDLLLSARNSQPIVVNAIEPQDLEVFAVALYEALACGKRFLYRTAADFVKAVGNIAGRPLLTRQDLIGPADHTAGGMRGGVIVVGSHTAKTTAQLEKLRSIPGLHFIEFNSDLVLEGRLDDERDRVTKLVDEDVRNGVTSVFYTKRKVLTVAGDTKEAALARSVQISAALTGVIGGMQEAPSYVIAKGGITSSDVGVKALKVRRAWVLGQVQPGIPVWQCGQESRFPGVPYVIFPGNVGDEDTLYKVVSMLQGTV